MAAGGRPGALRGGSGGTGATCCVRVSPADGRQAAVSPAADRACDLSGRRGAVRGGLPRTILADTGYASGRAVADLQAHGIEPLVAIGRTQTQRPYDFRPLASPKVARRISEPWRLAMRARLDQDDARTLYKRRKQTVEPVFGIIKSAMGFARFHLRGLHNTATEWTLVALAYNCRRINRMLAA